MAQYIKHVNSCKDLDAILSSAGPSRPVIIDFHATWCGPCKLVAPTFEGLAEKHHAKADFVKCDVDKAQDVAQRYSVTAMPTFIYLRNGVEAEQKTRGANGPEITQKVSKLVSGAPSTGAFVGKGQTLSGKTVAPEGAPGAFNLTPQAKVVIGLVAAYAVLWYFS